jgi:hypothetical protein
MAPAQMALPVDRRNGASAPRPAVVVPPVEVEVAASALDGEGQAIEVDEARPVTAVVPVWVSRVTTAAVVSVALVAAVASYEHMRALAALAGEGWRSWLLPLSVDGLAVAASMTMFVRRRAGLPAGRWPGWRCCWGWGRRWRQTSRRRTRRCRAGWWRRGRPSACCSPMSC